MYLYDHLILISSCHYSSVTVKENRAEEHLALAGMEDTRFSAYWEGRRERVPEEISTQSRDFFIHQGNQSQNFTIAWTIPTTPSRAHQLWKSFLKVLCIQRHEWLLIFLMLATWHFLCFWSWIRSTYVISYLHCG